MPLCILKEALPTPTPLEELALSCLQCLMRAREGKRGCEGTVRQLIQGQLCSDIQATLQSSQQQCEEGVQRAELETTLSFLTSKLLGPDASPMIAAVGNNETIGQEAVAGACQPKPIHAHNGR